MERNPTVYIILPVYNGENYFLEQLMSLYYQKYQNWYLIIVNDGSTDSSEDIAKKFIKDYDLYEKVKILKKENGGLNSAITRGFEEIKKLCDIHNIDNLVSYCDCDDIWTREKLAVQVKYMVDNPECGLSYHNMVGIDGNGILIKSSYVGDYYYHNEDFLYMSTFGNHYTGSELMFRAKYIDYILPMPLGEGMAQDFWTALVIGLLGIKIHYINKKLIYHKIREGSLQRIFEKKPAKEQNEIRMKYFYFLQKRFPNKDLTYIVNYNYDRFIIWYSKGYSLNTVHLLMLIKYPKLFFLGLKSFLFWKFLFIKHIWSLYR